MSRPFRSARSVELLAITSIGVLSVVGWVLDTARAGGRHRKIPRGTVMQIPVRPLSSPWAELEVFATDRGGPALVVVDRTTGTRVEVNGREQEWPFRWTAYRYASGERLEDRCVPTVWPHEAEIEVAKIPRNPQAPFDFDGDGIVDTLVESTAGEWVEGLPSLPYGGNVSVVSGRDGSELYFDGLERGTWSFRKRATPLGDLDGDGCSELALRAPYVQEPELWQLLWSRFFPVRDSIDIVSGSRTPR